ncbi:MAG: ATP-dependent Clp protease ATP-binding subunit, partial [Bacteroidales bacterium]|nr:ATP-dependent Clp protease ATP-binding subunit [Bacteroidales bacterium]
MSMNSSFSEEMRNIMQDAKAAALKYHSPQVGIEHVFVSILKSAESEYVKGLIFNDQTDLSKLLYDIESMLLEQENSIETQGTAAQVEATPQLNNLLRLSVLIAKTLLNPLAEPHHLLLATLKDTPSASGNVIKAMLNRMGVTYESVMAKIQKADNLGSHMKMDGFPMPANGDDDDEDRNFNRDNRKNHSKSVTPMLDTFGKDLTQYAEEGKLDLIVGREKELERIAQILSRRKKNNPVLIGEPGVGKSAIAEGLALRIKQGKVSRTLLDKRVISLDMTSLVAGTKYRGQFEERMQNILSEIARNPNIILFIDELHTMVGAGSSPGSLDASNMFKPALARGELQCIGATTLDEYRQYIEKDGALERRFQKIILEPTTPEETIEILNNIKDKYEEHHCVTYSDEAIKSCVTLSTRYITDRCLPDKAIDALDEAGSRVHILNVHVPPEYEEVEKEIENLQALKNQAVQDKQYDAAGEYRNQIKAAEEHLSQIKREWEAQADAQRPVVTEENVAEVVAMMTGVPVQRIAKSEGEKLLKMADELEGKVIGQDEAIVKIAKAIRRNRAGLKDPNKPIGTFIFLGPTGVGKTYLAKVLAEYLFDSADA